MAADITDTPPATVPDDTVFRAEATHVTRDHGDFVVRVAVQDDVEHVVLVRGDVSGREHVLCRVSSACVMSTALDSAECDCSGQVAAAMARIGAEDGVLIYLCDQEGRGHGITTKVQALKNKNDGMDTFEAVEQLGLPDDVRDYGVVARILAELGIVSVVLLSNNPQKSSQLCEAGVPVARTEPLEVRAPRHAWRHMVAKKDRGHTLSNAYMEVDHDTAELPVLASWLPPLSGGG